MKRTYSLVLAVSRRHRKEQEHTHRIASLPSREHTERSRNKQRSGAGTHGGAEQEHTEERSRNTQNHHHQAHAANE
jgi:hypothetical protein